MENGMPVQKKSKNEEAKLKMRENIQILVQDMDARQEVIGKMA